MLIQFTFSNFKSFRSVQTISLAANGRYRHSASSTIASDAPGLEDKRWVKGAIIYGANASGKSSILEALAGLQHMVINSAAVTDPKEPIVSILPFALAPDETESPTGYSVVFVNDKIRYEYRLAATRSRVWHESIRAFPRVHEQLWFSRDWNPEISAYEWTPDRPTGFQRDTTLENYTLPNVLFLSKAIANNRTELEPVFRWFKERLVFLDLSNRRGPLDVNFTATQLVDKTHYASNIVKLLQHADIGVTDATVHERKRGSDEVEKVINLLPPEIRDQARNARWMTPELSHRGRNKKSLPLPWDSESAGTHRLFAIAGPWLDILNRGAVAFIDELETSMHPLIVRELLRIFFSENENKNGAQLIVTTQSPLLLDATLIRRDQVWFTDKDDEGASHFYSLMDYQPRQGESLARGYLAGRYGAVPFIPRGLLGSFETAAIAAEEPPDA